MRVLAVPLHGVQCCKDLAFCAPAGGRSRHQYCLLSPQAALRQIPRCKAMMSTCNPCIGSRETDRGMLRLAVLSLRSPKLLPPTVSPHQGHLALILHTQNNSQGQKGLQQIICPAERQLVCKARSCVARAAAQSVHADLKK